MKQEAVIIKGLSFKYPDGRQALNDISLTIFPGEIVGLIGPNGAGKSTLLLHLNGILHSENQNGAINILGKFFEQKNLRWIRSRVGLVFQNPDDQLFSPTVFEDIAFGPLNMGLDRNQGEQAVKKALESVHMAGYEERAPHHLSLGEKKRIAIAAVLAMGPEILVFDEPTSNLDPRGRWELIKLFRQLPGTKIIATHDLEMVRTLCTRTVIMDRGRITADGETCGILENLPLLRASGLAPEDEGQ